jgi:hypothetical protein
MTIAERWKAAYLALSLLFVVSAFLNLARIRGGFLTSHLADIVVPAWMYITSRGLVTTRRKRLALVAWLGRTPERAALLLFVASALTEISQYFWPQGLFSGRFDPFDILAFAAGLLPCYLADRFGGRVPGEAR